MQFLKKAQEKTGDELPMFFRRVKEEHQGTKRIKRRVIYEPNNAMRKIHDGLREYLVSQPRFPQNAPPTLAKNAEPHRMHQYFYLTDIKNAFGSVQSAKIVEAFCMMNSFWLRQKHELERFIEQYCIAPEGGLYMGSPSSPALFELYAWAFLDRPIADTCTWWEKWNLRKYCEWHGITYTRYVDDLTFSRNGLPIGGGSRKAIRWFIRKAGFEINDSKNRVIDLLDRRTEPRIVITGIGIAFGGRMFVPQSYMRKLEKMLIAGIRGDEINPHEIEGLMSVFWAPYGGKSKEATLNRTQKKVLGLYHAWRQLREKNNT